MHHRNKNDIGLHMHHIHSVLSKHIHCILVLHTANFLDNSFGDLCIVQV